MRKKAIKISGIILAIILIAVIVVARNLARQAVPDYNRNVYLKNMKDEVTITRDANAVPTIYATNEQDLYRAAGYVIAQDRLWQMDLLRRASTGNLSELFGEDYVDTDLLMRSLRIPEQSKRVMQNSDPEIISALEAFADGVNQFINQNYRNLPPEFSLLGYKPEKWEPVHSVNFIGFMAWEVGGEWSTELILHRMQQHVNKAMLMEMIPDKEAQNSLVHPGFMLSSLQSYLQQPSAKLKELGLEVFTGSNSWAIAGDRSITGKPIFANDMHLFLFAPGIWYQMHHVIEGKLNVTGVVMPGQPFVIAGHNERIAWGMTSVMVDDVDFFQETINKANPNQYLFNDEWLDMEVRLEKVNVRNKKHPVEREVRFTHRGPVVSDINDQGGQAISMRWLGHEHGNELRSLYLLNRAGNWDDFRDALSTFSCIAQNVNYADVDGNIGIQTAAGIPIRTREAKFVVPGGDDSYDWTGIVPFEQLPFTYNPPEGYIISANNKTAPPDYPYHISHWFAPPQRYDRIKEMLLEKDLLTVEDFSVMLGDRKSKLTEQMLPCLLEELQKLPATTANQQWAISMLQQWDLVYLPEYPQPLIFEKFMQQFVENILISQVSEDLYQDFMKDKLLVMNLLDRIWRTKESAWLQHNSFGNYTGFTAMVHKSFSETITWIEDNLGRDTEKWAWGKVHKLTLVHPVGTVGLLDKLFRMNLGSYSPGGSFHTVCPFSYNPVEPFKIMHGASHRHIYNTANWDKSLSIIPTGISGIPASKHYSDQTEMYVNNQYHNDIFSIKKAREAARYTMMIFPESLSSSP